MTFDLDLDLDLEHTLDAGALGTIVCNFGRNPAICLRQKAIFVIGTKALVSRDL